MNTETARQMTEDEWLKMLGLNISDQGVSTALDAFGVDRVRRGMTAFPRIPMVERPEGICACFVGRAWAEGREHFTDAFGRALETNYRPSHSLSWIYERQPERLQALATDWLAKQDAIEEVTQPHEYATVLR